METKLKSVLKNPILRLTFKSFLFGLLLVATNPVIFFIGAFLLYARPLFRTLEFLIPLLALLPIASISSSLLQDTYYFWPAIGYLSFLFLILLGIKDLVLVKRIFWESVLRLGLAYASFLVFFYYSQSYFLASLILLFLFILFLLRFSLKQRVFYWAIAFLLLEGVWAISLLPVGFISSATLALLVFWTLTSLALDYSRNKQSKKFLLLAISLFIILSIIVLGFSRWSL